MDRFSPSPYGRIRPSNQPQSTQVGSGVPAGNSNTANTVPPNHSNTVPPSASDAVVTGTSNTVTHAPLGIWQQDGQGHGQYIYPAPYPAYNPVDVGGAPFDDAPVSLALLDPMLDQALGTFLPHAANDPRTYASPSDLASAVAERPHANERLVRPERLRSPDSSIYREYSGDPDIAEFSSAAPGRPSKRAAGKRRASALTNSSPEPKEAVRPSTRPSKRTKAKATDDAKPALFGQSAPPDWKKQDGIREPAPALKPSGMYYDSFEEADSKMNHPNWTSPADDTVPTTSAELAPYVAQLVDAIKDMSQLKDKLDNRSISKRWLDKHPTGPQSAILTNDFYMPHILEWLAWKIATTIQRLHLHGPGTLPCHDPLILELSFADKHLTFAARFTAMLDICRLRKSRVASMLEGGMLERYVLMPSTVLAASDTAAAANSRRAGILREGRGRWEEKNPERAVKRRDGVGRRGGVR